MVRDQSKGKTLSVKELIYDPRLPGKLEKTKDCLELDGSQSCKRWATTSFSRDDFGNAYQIKNPRQNTITTGYDHYGLYGDNLRNSAGYSVVRQNDIKRGVVLESVAYGSEKGDHGVRWFGESFTSVGPGKAYCVRSRRRI